MTDEATVPDAPEAVPAPEPAVENAAPVVADPAPAVEAPASWKSELADLLRKAAGSHVLAGNPLDSAKILNDVADLLGE